MLELAYILPLTNVLEDFPGLFLETNLWMSSCAYLHEEEPFHLHKWEAPPTIFLEKNLKNARKPQTKMMQRVAKKVLRNMAQLVTVMACF